MITYIIRRLLYSMLVLIAASFSSLRSSRRAPATRSAHSAITPNVDQAGPRAHRRGEAPERLGLRALRLLGEDAVTDGFGDRLLTNKPILPELWRVMKNTLQLVIVAELLAILSPSASGCSPRYASTPSFDYTATTFSFLGLAMPLFWLALMLQVLVVQIQLDGL